MTQRVFSISTGKMPVPRGRGDSIWRAGKMVCMSDLQQIERELQSLKDELQVHLVESTSPEKASELISRLRQYAERLSADGHEKIAKGLLKAAELFEKELVGVKSRDWPRSENLDG